MLAEPDRHEQPPERENWPLYGPIYSDSGSPPEKSEYSQLEEGDYDEEDLPTPAQLMSIARAADSLSRQSDLGRRRSAMTRSWRAFNNEHPEGSRYRSENYAARSKLYVPKTRSAVIKNCVSFASALFSTNDVVSVSGERESDPRQRASAAVIKADLNIRLDRTSSRSGIPWFWIAIAACIDAQVTGVCISKQYWSYEFCDDVFEVAGVEGDEGVVVGMDGKPIQRMKKRRVLKDRFEIELHPAENIIIDMAAPFYDVMQAGAFLIAKIPMHIGEVKTMMKPGRQHMGGSAWYSIPEDVMAAAATDYTNASVRQARDKGADRYSKTNTAQINDLQIVWVHENFIHWGGRDYQFWSLGTTRLLSEPVETIEAYPAMHGNRPYVMGVSSIEPHNALPMSPVESWRPLQDETNNLRNLTLDTIAQYISPIKKVVRGRQVDLRQLRKMGPDATIMVKDKDDVTFEVPPTNAAAGFEQMDRLAVEFDELAGNFSTSAVQSNRNLNETVGGMKLLSGSATGKTEYDLRIIIETWVEPVMRQVVWLLQHFESDERILAIAGDKAKLFEKFEIDGPPDMSLLEEEMTVKVNVGIGAADPMQRLTKFIGSLKMLQEIAASGAFQGQVMADAKALFDEVLGLSGYPDAERFFRFVSPEEAAAKAPPTKEALEAKKLEMEMGRATKEDEFKDKDNEFKDREMQLSERTQDRDIGLRTAAQNKSLIDEATGEAKEVMEPQEARPPLPVETMLTDTMGQLMQVMSALGMAQQRQVEMMTAMIEEGRAQRALLTDLLRFQRAPKEIIYGENGRPKTLLVADEAMPLGFDQANRVAGVAGAAAQMGA